VDLSLPEEVVALKATVVRLFEREVLPVMGGFEARAEFPRALIATLGEAGLFGAAFPEDLGGSEMGFLAVATIAEEVSRLSPAFGYAMNMQAMTCPFTIYNWGSEDQVARFVPDLIAGRRIGMFALTEPGGGSDAAGAMRTSATLDGDVYRLNGSKQFITLADVCDSGLLFARTDPAAGHRGISAFIVEPGSGPGFDAQPIALSGLSRSLRSSAIHLDDFAVPVANRLGEEGQGFAVAMNALEYGRLTVSSRLVGLAQACLDEACAYARERVVGGRPIAEYQMVQHLIADMTVDIEAARLMVHRTAFAMDNGAPSTRASSQAKYLAGRAAKHAAQAVAEIFAGYALAEDSAVARITAYVNMLSVGEGTPNVQRILIAEDALGIKDANRHPVRNRFAHRNQ
jgi:alkylation response protein AidB-like acyl-CoA dehydrogenase